MAKGISVFCGMKYTAAENLQFIQRAKELGFSTIFTSLHIPEADYKNAVEEFKALVALADSLDMKVTADISPRAFSYLNAGMNNLKPIRDLGIYGVRVDFGFTPAEIAEFSRNPYGLIIELNASTVTVRFLAEIEKYSPDFTKLQACHNYYPRLNTGISEETLLAKNTLLKKYNLKVAAFLPSQVNRRGPIFEGLPTLEKHRTMNPGLAAKHLYALGLDDVIFGDSIPAFSELETVGRIREDVIEFTVKTFACSEAEEKIIFECVHENRPDPAEDVIRSPQSRILLNSGQIIEPFNTVQRKRGALTIDNKNYLRYSGELQVCLRELPADPRVNVVGQIEDRDLFLLGYINEETKFKFVSIREGHASDGS